MGLLTRLDRFLVKFEEVLLALLLVALIVLAATQVLLRNVWSTSIDWADVTLQNATVLIALLGAAIATSEGRHLNIDLVGRTLSGRRRLALNILIGIFGVIICALLTRGGWQTYRANYEPWLANVPAGWSTMRLLQQELSEGGFPQWLSQLMLPFGFGLIGLHFFLRLARDLSWLFGGEDGDGEKEQHEGDRYLDHMVAITEGEEAPVEDEMSAEPPRQAPSPPRGERGGSGRRDAGLEAPKQEKYEQDKHGQEKYEQEKYEQDEDEPATAREEEDEQEDATTAAMTPKHRRTLGEEAAGLSQKARASAEPLRQGVSAELDEATVSDALSDTLVPEAVRKTATHEAGVAEDGDDEGETLVDSDLQDEPTGPAEGDLAEAATELAVPRDDDEEKQR